MNIFEFLCTREQPLIVVMSKFNIEQTLIKLIEKGIEPVSYSELDENDIEPGDIEYIFK